MMNFVNNHAASQYRTMGLQGVVDEASPHELVRRLLEGGMARIAAAKGQMERGEVAAKGESIGRAIGIIEGLRTSLDRTTGADVANNLENLYDYMVRRLVVANVRNDVAVLDEVEALLGQVCDGWSAIGPQPSAAVPTAGSTPATVS
jgi:flagellar secretion chaperone FliS